MLIQACSEPIHQEVLLQSVIYFGAQRTRSARTVLVHQNEASIS